MVQARSFALCRHNARTRGHLADETRWLLSSQLKTIHQSINSINIESILLAVPPPRLCSTPDLSICFGVVARLAVGILRWESRLQGQQQQLPRAHVCGGDLPVGGGCLFAARAHRPAFPPIDPAPVRPCRSHGGGATSRPAAGICPGGYLEALKHLAWLGQLSSRRLAVGSGQRGAAATRAAPRADAAPHKKA